MLAGQVMVKGVVHHPEYIQAADGLDCIHCHALAAQGGYGEAQGLDKTQNPVLAQDQRQFAQRRAQTSRALRVVARIARLIERAHHQAFGPALTGVGGQFDCLGTAFVIPHIKGVQRVDRQHLDALRCAQFTHAAGGCAVFDFTVLEVVADLNGLAVESRRQLDEIRQGQVGGDHAVEGKT